MMVPPVAQPSMTMTAPAPTIEICRPMRSVLAVAERTLATDRPRSIDSSARACWRRQRPATAGSMPIATIASALRIAAAVSPCTPEAAWLARALGRRTKCSVATATAVRSTVPIRPMMP